jgi:hypothetical protein
VRRGRRAQELQAVLSCIVSTEGFDAQRADLFAGGSVEAREELSTKHTGVLTDTIDNQKHTKN